MEGLRKGSLFPFLEKGREEGLCPAFPAPGGQLRAGRLLVRIRQRIPYGFRLRERGDSFSSSLLHPAGLLPSANFCLRPDGRWAICPCAPYAGPCRNIRWSRPCSAGRTRACDPFGGAVRFSSMVRLRCLPLRIQARMSRRGGSGMTRERPVKSGFSGCEQKKHCLLPRLGIWTFDCVREVAAWGR